MVVTATEQGRRQCCVSSNSNTLLYVQENGCDALVGEWKEESSNNGKWGLKGEVTKRKTVIFKLEKRVRKEQ